MRFFAFVLVLLTARAWALDLEYYKFTLNPTYSQTDNALLSNGYVPNNARYLFNAAFDYVKVPLSIERNGQRIDEIVKNQTSLHLGGSYRLKKNLLFGVRSRVTQLKTDAGSGTFLGDTFLESVWKFYQNQKTAYALHPKLTLPTGSSQYTTQNHKVGAYLGLNIERKFDWFQAALNLGYSQQPGATLNFGSNFSEIDYKQSVFTAIGFLFPIKEKWSANLEAYRYTQMKGTQHPNEIYAGLRHQSTQSLATFAGVSSGGGHIDGSSNDYRISVGVKFYPSVAQPQKVVAAPVVKPTARPPSKPKTKREALLQKEKEDNGVLSHSENVYFANNSVALDSTARSILDRLKPYFNNEEDVSVVLEGFASSNGNPAANFILSENRALMVKNYLAKEGMKVEKVKSVAYGDARADAQSSDSLNRKVMIRIYNK
jgi:outer membrane protein OmpA-like peptidoglycan-associated protein